MKVFLMLMSLEGSTSLFSKCFIQLHHVQQAILKITILISNQRMKLKVAFGLVGLNTV